MRNDVVNTNEFSFWYGDFQALKGLTFNISAYKITALIGPSGCGKSTYLKCLNPKEFLSINPKFSEDFSKLLFIGVKESFISHTTNFQLSYLNWPPVEGIESTLVIDKFKRYPNLPSD